MIHISNLNFNYQKSPLLFKDLSLTQEAGSITGLLGKNGSGKSTLMKIIAGLMDAPKTEINVMNDTPFKRNPSFLEELFFVPEDYVLPETSIKKFIKLKAKFYPHFDPHKLEDLFCHFGLTTENKITELSYGQRKKFLIAFALATNCKLLLLDEPTNGLDIQSKTIFRQILASSVTENQLVLISTHQVKDIDNLIDKIIIIDQGKVAFNESLWSISEKYVFSNTNTPIEENILYQEPGAIGSKIIKPAAGESSPIDIELLFNAVISGVKFNQ